MPPYLVLFERLIERARGSLSDLEPLDFQIPVAVYTDSVRFAQEREKLFLKQPLILGHASQIPEPGDAIVHDWLGLPLVTVRDKSGAIGTFMNVCRHRGMRLVDEMVDDSGPLQLKSFVCPYHQWTYGLDGQLRNIPLQESFAGLDASEYNLVSLPTEVRHGLIWMQATPNQSMDLDTHLAGIGEDLDAFGLPEAHFFRQHKRSVKSNWKLVQDAFLDGYHVVRLHKNTVGQFFPDCISLSDSVGQHIRSAVARNEIEQAVDTAPSEWDLRQQASFAYMLFPSSVFVMHPDYTSHIGLFPMSVDQTLFVHSMMVPELPVNEKMKEHYNRSFELIDGGVFQAEDIRVCEGAQRGFAAGANEHLLCGGHEVALKTFHETLEQALQQD